jgi:glycosyltransferase involved in cell wall biosynthesis
MVKVSICIVTYNQEKYIAEAIDSVLMQKTDFEYEIIIGEDGSSDRTSSIVKAYKKKHPEKITLFLNDRSNVIYIEGRATARWNLINNLKHAKGQYIALLDGDDYWTDENKLQEQIDFLDSHPDHTICFHDVYIKKENSFEKETLFPGIIPLTFHQLLDNNFIPTCSVVYRKIFDFNEIPEWYKYSAPMGDWPLHVLHAHKGKIGKINKAMATYREHDNGYWALPRANLETKIYLDNKALNCFYEHFKNDNVLANYINTLVVRNKIMVLMSMLLTRQNINLLKYYYETCLTFRKKDYISLFFSTILTLKRNKILYIKNLADFAPNLYR